MNQQLSTKQLSVPAVAVLALLTACSAVVGQEPMLQKTNLFEARTDGYYAYGSLYQSHSKVAEKITPNTGSSHPHP